ncbi:TPA: hypothetical protein TVE80_001145 [Streptococcus equi subsp. zooepidemicus]|nr:hypothetical protein [Streptococcus equi subsp. zooepidemicus]HEL1280180.1 hypothetical protein [Streptococcus equi subsp. zooepidemicus]
MYDEPVIHNGKFYLDWRDFEDGNTYDLAVLIQSTGLFDKNGVEIFEGDVVEYNEGEYSFIGKVVKTVFGLYVKAYDNFSFEDFSDENTMIADVKIIGNIYQNSDLLESVEE